MKIGIDAHVIGRAKGGVETHVANLVRGLHALDPVNDYTVFVSPEGADFAAGLHAPNFSFELLDSTNLAFQRFVRLPRRCAQLHIDVLHVQRVAPVFLNAARVVTIHDVAQHSRPDLFEHGEAFALRRLVEMSAKLADRIITVSETSRDDIARLFGVPAERIATIPNGVDPPMSREAMPRLEVLAERCGVRSSYLLCVGAIEKRKNLGRLVQAYARLSARSKDVPILVVVGPVRTRGLDSELERLCEASNLSGRVVFTGHVDAETLGALYASAHAFVFPSLLEGFGLPPLEALTYGLPVAVSDIRVHREVLADSVVYFDPTDVDAMESAMRVVIENDAIRGDLAQRGPIRAARYTWERMAQETLSVYEQIASQVTAPSGGRTGRG